MVRSGCSCNRLTNATSTMRRRGSFSLPPVHESVNQSIHLSVSRLTFRLSALALCSKMLVICITVLLGFPMSTGRGAACPAPGPPLAAGSNLFRSSLTCPQVRQRYQSHHGDATRVTHIKIQNTPMTLDSEYTIRKTHNKEVIERLRLVSHDAIKSTQTPG